MFERTHYSSLLSALHITLAAEKCGQVPGIYEIVNRNNLQLHQMNDRKFQASIPMSK